MVRRIARKGKQISQLTIRHPPYPIFTVPYRHLRYLSFCLDHCINLIFKCTSTNQFRHHNVPGLANSKLGNRNQIKNNQYDSEEKISQVSNNLMWWPYAIESAANGSPVVVLPNKATKDQIIGHKLDIPRDPSPVLRQRDSTIGQRK